jgi:hypothetical protein
MARSPNFNLEAIPRISGVEGCGGPAIESRNQDIKPAISSLKLTDSKPFVILIIV